MRYLGELYAELAADKLFEDKVLVPGEGDPRAAIVLVGEAPGAEETLQKRPFVGKAGKNLDGFLAVLELNREDIFITNAVKVRPTKMSEKGRLSNRPPTKAELAVCADCLKKELAYIAPKVTVTLGNTALRAVTGDAKVTIGEVHGRPIVSGERTVFALYHPASIIYRRELLEVYNEDLEKLKKYLSEQQITEG